jgi:hypothetical protein
MIINIITQGFLLLLRFAIIVGIYYYFKQPIDFYDKLIILGFVSIWEIEGSLTAIYNKMEVK